MTVTIHHRCNTQTSGTGSSWSPPVKGRESEGILAGAQLALISLTQSRTLCLGNEADSLFSYTV